MASLQRILLNGDHVIPEGFPAFPLLLDLLESNNFLPPSIDRRVTPFGATFNILEDVCEANLSCLAFL